MPTNHLQLVGGQAVHRQLVGVVPGLVREIDQVAFRAGEDLDHRPLVPNLDAMLRDGAADADDIQQARWA
jgi:hypothetical protein